jgi:hypothetical protein
MADEDAVAITADPAAADIGAPRPMPVEIDPAQAAELERSEARAAILAKPQPCMLEKPILRGSIDRLVWLRDPRGLDGDEVNGAVAIADEVGNVVASYAITVVNGYCVGLQADAVEGARGRTAVLPTGLDDLKAAVGDATDPAKRRQAVFEWMQSVGLMPAGSIG